MTGYTFPAPRLVTHNVFTLKNMLIWALALEIVTIIRIIVIL